MRTARGRPILTEAARKALFQAGRRDVFSSADPVPHSARHRPLVGLILLGLLALPASATARHCLWNLHLWRRLLEARREAPQTALDKYLRRMEPYLPAAGPVGLVQSGAPSPEAWSRTLYLTQYALAPRLVVPSACCEFVIEYGPETLPSTLEPALYAPVAAAGPDLRLLRRVGR